MSKDNDTKHRFIELRGNGLSFDKIARDIGVSKGTLLKWEKELKQEISEVRFIELESMIQKYGVLRTERVKSYGEMLEKYRKELTQRDLSDVSTNKLLDMALIVEDRLREEMKDIRHYSKETDIKGFDFDMKVPKDTWCVED